MEEQNVDANGNIKVAQQGPVDVNVVQQPLSAVIPVLVNASAPAYGDTGMSYVDVRACSHLDIFAEGGVAESAIGIYSSIDGTSPFSKIVLTGVGGQHEFYVGYTGNLTSMRHAGTLLYGDAVQAVSGATGLRAPYIGLIASGGANALTGLNVSLYCN